jgi:hypothetical protein
LWYGYPKKWEHLYLGIFFGNKEETLYEYHSKSGDSLKYLSAINKFIDLFAYSHLGEG